MLRALLLVLLLLIPISAQAQKRVALIVGIESYSIQRPLRSSRNDANLIAKLLQSQGFALVGGQPLVDLDKRQYDRYIEQFGYMAMQADVAVFYYSGHGMQIGGTNYLFPTDSPHVDFTNIPFRFINMDTVMRILDHTGARLKIVLLDACRNNPFVSDGKSNVSGSGLAQMNAPAGTIIGFATQPGNVAADGPETGNSPYTAALYEAALKPGHNQFRVFNEAALRVMRKSNGQQQPWMSASPITADFFFTPPVVAYVPTAPVTASLSEVMPQPASLPAVPILAAADINSPANLSLSYTQEASRLFEQLNYRAGRATLTEGINAGQRSAIMYSYRGFSWFQDGLNTKNKHEALTMFRAGFPDFDTAIRLESTYPNSYRHRGNMIVATWKALKVTGQRTNEILDRAIEDLTNAALLDPKSETSAYFLGEAYNLRGKRGDYDSALYWFKKALEIRPKFVAPYSGTCYALRMKGDIVGARNAARRAARGDSNQADMGCLNKVAWERYVPKF